MDAATLVREGRPAEALDALKQEIRADASDPKRRVFLFQLLSVLGQWEKAADQLQVAGEMDASLLLLANVYRSAIRSELLRAEVFAGKRTPLFVGEPQAWVGDMLEAVRALADGRPDDAMALRDRGLEEAPAIGGTITVGENEPSAFDWLADGDSRLGPIVELILEGKYYWVPMSRIRSLDIQQPTDLRDLIWTPCEVIWTNGGDASGLLFARYPDVGPEGDPAELMARATSWREPVEGYLVGSGARAFVTEADEFALVNTRRVDFDHPDEPQQASDG